MSKKVSTNLYTKSAAFGINSAGSFYMDCVKQDGTKYTIVWNRLTDKLDLLVNGSVIRTI